MLVIAWLYLRATFTWDEYAVIACLAALGLVLEWILTWRRASENERRDLDDRAADRRRELADQERDRADRAADARAAADLAERTRALELAAAEARGAAALEDRIRAMELELAEARGRAAALAELDPGEEACEPA